jgi:glutamate racemase
MNFDEEIQKGEKQLKELEIKKEEALRQEKPHPLTIVCEHFDYSAKELERSMRDFLAELKRRDAIQKIEKLLQELEIKKEEGKPHPLSLKFEDFAVNGEEMEGWMRGIVGESKQSELTKE